MSEILRVTGLSRAFGDSIVLVNIDLALDRDARLAVVGASGSGKTTLLRLIAGLDVPTSGEIAIDGTTVSRAGDVLVPPERRDVAMVFQGLALFPHLRALEQIAFAARGRGGIETARQLLEAVGLGNRAQARLDELSGGERQRIALARALAQEPKLLLMDEPFANLDDQRRAEMRELLRQLLNGTRTTLILVTHSSEDVCSLAEQVTVLDGGRPVVSGTLADVFANPRHAAAVRSLGIGQILEGQVEDGRVARTPFGDVALTRSVSPGVTQILVRDAQPKLADGGSEAVVVSIELRPPNVPTSATRRIALVRAADQTLRVDVGDSSIAPGQTVRVSIEGPCQPLEG